MYQKARPLFLVTESPLHAGSGSDLGDIDLPIQRESHTGFPKVEASSLKGALRLAFEAKVGHPDFSKGKPELDSDPIKLHRVFGYDDDPYSQKEENGKKSEKKLLQEALKESKDFAGCIGFTDARILLFPVKSLKGIFAWVTCPAVLKRFKHEMETICNPQIDLEEFPNEIHEKTSVSIEKAKVAIKPNNTPATIQLEDYTYDNIKFSEDVDKIAKWMKENVLSRAFFSEKILQNLVILPDDDFTDFIRFSTEVVTRTKIDNETGTVQTGALFTEEYLPTETVLYSLVLFSNEFRDKNANSWMDYNAVEKFFTDNIPSHFQLGANATLGKGIMSTNYLKENS